MSIHNAYCKLWQLKSNVELRYERQGTADWGTREILHQDAPPNGRQEWGRYADADGNFAAVTAIRQHNSFTQEVQVHLWVKIIVLHNKIY